MSRIHLTIDRLVLKGLPQGHDKLLVEALRTQLTRALSDRSIRADWARSHRTPVLKLGRVALDPGSTGARKFGTQLARGISRGLKP